MRRRLALDVHFSQQALDTVRIHQTGSEMLDMLLNLKG